MAINSRHGGGPLAHALQQFVMPKRRCGPILLKKGFSGVEQIFSGAIDAVVRKMTW